MTEVIVETTVRVFKFYTWTQMAVAGMAGLEPIVSDAAVDAACLAVVAFAALATVLSTEADEIALTLHNAALYGISDASCKFVLAAIASWTHGPAALVLLAALGVAAVCTGACVLPVFRPRADPPHDKIALLGFAGAMLAFACAIVRAAALFVRLV